MLDMKFGGFITPLEQVFIQRWIATIGTNMASAKLTSEWNESVQPVITQVKPTPKHQAENSVVSPP